MSKRKLQTNPDPLRVQKRRDNVTGVDALRGRSRVDRLRAWIALGGSESDFPYEDEQIGACDSQGQEPS